MGEGCGKAEVNGLGFCVCVDFGLRSSRYWWTGTGQDKAFRNGKVSRSAIILEVLSLSSDLLCKSYVARVAKGSFPSGIERALVFVAPPESVQYNHTPGVVRTNVPFEYNSER